VLRELLHHLGLAVCATKRHSRTVCLQYWMTSLSLVDYTCRRRERCGARTSQANVPVMSRPPNVCVSWCSPWAVAQSHSRRHRIRSPSNPWHRAVARHVCCAHVRTSSPSPRTLTDVPENLQALPVALVRCACVQNHGALWALAPRLPQVLLFPSPLGRCHHRLASPTCHCRGINVCELCVSVVASFLFTASVLIVNWSLAYAVMSHGGVAPV
jgi:hypothetical protein